MISSESSCMLRGCRVSIDFINEGIKSLSITNGRENENITFNFIPTSGVFCRLDFRGFFIGISSFLSSNYLCSSACGFLFTILCTFPAQFKNFRLILSIRDKQSSDKPHFSVLKYLMIALHAYIYIHLFFICFLGQFSTFFIIFYRTSHDLERERFILGRYIFDSCNL